MKRILWIILAFTLLNCQDDDNVIRPDVTLSEFTDARDQYTYKCIEVGDQVWMAENLRFALTGQVFDGCWTWNEVMPEITTKGFVKLAGEYWIHSKISDDLYLKIDSFNDEGLSYQEMIVELGDELPKEFLEDFYKCSPNKEFYNDYGYLYTYDAAMKAVPEGWRLPTDEDWKKLEAHLGMNQKEIEALDRWRGDGQGDLLKCGEGNLGFDALLCGGKLFGVGDKVNVFSQQGTNAYFWSSSIAHDTDSTQVAVVRGVGLWNSGILRFNSRVDKTAYSVRCVKDKK